VRKHGRDTGQREGVTTAEAARVWELEFEVRELHRSDEILKRVGAFFAQAELDRRWKSGAAS
jgi:transposase